MGFTGVFATLRDCQGMLEGIGLSGQTDPQTQNASQRLVELHRFSANRGLPLPLGRGGLQDPIEKRALHTQKSLHA